jgi:hypothetical protein
MYCLPVATHGHSTSIFKKKEVFIYYSGIKQYMVVLSPMPQHYFRKKRKQKQEMALVSGLIQM